jgi:HSP20 family protein
MSIMRRDPFEAPVSTMNRLMNQLWNDSFVQNGGVGAMEEAALPLDVIEENNSIVVRASVPGFNPDEVDVQIHNGVLTIRAEHSEEKEEKGERYLRRERRWGSLVRSVALPSTVEDDRCEAELKDGVLSLRIPKSEKALPRKIKVGGGKGGSKPNP